MRRLLQSDHLSLYPPPPPQTIRHIDCLGTFFEAVIYQYKNNEGMVIHRYTKKQPLNRYFEA